MTNEEKARQIAIEYENLCVIDLEDVALQAMQWKDERFAKQKQQLIERALIATCNMCQNAKKCTFKGVYDCPKANYIKKAMEEL